MNFNVVQQLLLLTAAVAIDNVDSLENQWSGGCSMSCGKDLQFFCDVQTSTCMNCVDVCNDDGEYMDICLENCKGYLGIPEHRNVWKGCSGFCNYDIHYYCEVSASTCMQCRYICEKEENYYDYQLCVRDCNGYYRLVIAPRETSTGITTDTGVPENNTVKDVSIALSDTGEAIIDEHGSSALSVGVILAIGSATVFLIVAAIAGFCLYRRCYQKISSGFKLCCRKKLKKSKEESRRPSGPDAMVLLENDVPSTNSNDSGLHENGGPYHAQMNTKIVDSPTIEACSPV